MKTLVIAGTRCEYPQEEIKSLFPEESSIFLGDLLTEESAEKLELLMKMSGGYSVLWDGEKRPLVMWALQEVCWGEQLPKKIVTPGTPEEEQIPASLKLLLRLKKEMEKEMAGRQKAKWKILLEMFGIAILSGLGTLVFMAWLPFSSVEIHVLLGILGTYLLFLSMGTALVSYLEN